MNSTTYERLLRNEGLLFGFGFSPHRSCDLLGYASWI